MRVGYVRISTVDQKTVRQLDDRRPGLHRHRSRLCGVIRSSALPRSPSSVTSPRASPPTAMLGAPIQVLAIFTLGSMLTSRPEHGPAGCPDRLAVRRRRQDNSDAYLSVITGTMAFGWAGPATPHHRAQQRLTTDGQNSASRAAQPPRPTGSRPPPAPPTRAAAPGPARVSVSLCQVRRVDVKQRVPTAVPGDDFAGRRSTNS
jgi:hypothetical protein